MRNIEMKLYDGKVYGFEVSCYGLENGYLDYQTLAQIVGPCILNNTVFEVGYWGLINGDDCEDVYQFYIIDQQGSKFLEEYTDEIVYYNDELDMYLWGITHFGTAWSHVLTDIKLVK